MKSQDRQEVPAIVRRVAGVPGVDYEVICGARRHWTVTWLRAHDHPEFRFLIEPCEMSDEEAFRVSDLENRSRKNLTDFERAADYARAIDRYYDGSQQRMAERLNVAKSWLSRYPRRHPRTPREAVVAALQLAAYPLRTIVASASVSSPECATDDVGTIDRRG